MEKDTIQERTPKREHKVYKKVRQTAVYQSTGMRFQLLLYNAIPLLVVEALYEALTILIVWPAFFSAITMLVSFSSIEILDIESLMQFLLSPIPLLCTIALLLCLGVYSLLETSAAIFAFDASRQHKHVSVLEIAEFSLKNSLRVIHPKNFLISFVALVMLPVIGASTATTLISSASIPRSVYDFFLASSWLPLVLVALIVLLIVFALRWSFALHFFTIERTNFFASVKKSAHLNRWHRILNLVSTLLVQLALALLNTILVAFGLKVALLFIDTVGAQTVFGSVVLTLIFVVFGSAILILSTLSAPIGILKISANYYSLKERAGEEIPPITYKPRKLPRLAKRVIGVIVGIGFVGCILSFALLFHETANGRFDYYESLNVKTEITGYRGCITVPTDVKLQSLSDLAEMTSLQDTLTSNYLPPNSLIGIKAAADLGANNVTVDAQVSQDGLVFIASGSYLGSSTATYKNAWEVTYDEIASNGLSIVYSARFPNETVPLLSDAIKTAANCGVGIIIDVSSLSYCDDGVERVLDVITKSGYTNSCEIASRNYDDIVFVEEQNSAITTVYIAGVAFGSFESYESADAIALESVAATESAVNTLHQQGFEAYGWCIDSQETISLLALRHIENIVTSNIETATKATRNLGFSDFGYGVFDAVKKSANKSSDAATSMNTETSETTTSNNSTTANERE